MFEFKFNENFEPTRNTKEWYLYTHKTENTFSGVPLPGLFQTTYFEWQIIGFICIFLIEGIATYWAYYEGVMITAILASIFIDLVLAIMAHIFQRDICKMRNELVYEDDKKIGAIKRKLKFTLLKQRSFYMMILLSAVFKIYWFLSVYGIIDAITLFIIISYLTGALLHMTCTGYAIFTFIFNRKITREHNKYIDSGGESFAFDTNNPLPASLNSSNLVAVEAGRHNISLNEADGKYYLYTYGVLTDTELHTMIGHQLNAEQKRLVAIEGVKHQMQILEQSPMKSGSNEDRKLYNIKSVTQLLIIFGLFFILTGCGSNELKEFSLSLIVSEKIGNFKTDKLPNNIIDLSLPIEYCEKFNLVPKPFLYRLGYPPESRKQLKIDIKGGFAGDKNNIRLISRKTAEHLSTIEIGEIFAQETNPSINLMDELDKKLAAIRVSNKKQLILFYNESGIEENNYREIKVYETINSIRRAISNEFCKNGLSSVVIFINPPTKQSTVTPETDLENLNRITDIAGQMGNSTKKKEILDSLTEPTNIAINKNPYNYFPVYIKMKNRIYGKEHTEAFELLEKAAVIAIENNETRYLLDRIRGDQNTILWKLSHGHDHHWNDIIHALEQNDISLLR